MAVTLGNVEEYLRLFVRHRLVGSIAPQVSAFRDGLGVFVSGELREQLCQCCTPSDLQLLLCGTPTIDVNDWERESRYGDGYTAQSPAVQWFWRMLHEMNEDLRAKVLHFCTGSTRAPATGFADLMGCAKPFLFLLACCGCAHPSHSLLWPSQVQRRTASLYHHQNGWSGESATDCRNVLQ